ncbi:prolyl 4-hydroxylase [Rhodoferax sp. OV413]|uniref:2OG-Fe(II) oxygenase n=1 Tax=Rhodoferax sp. OV413 TaxID=1855285 RepID=UPI000883FEA2|nr:2OG-Fe(II) oxygenase [Rhodoferax sp. OV413]SDP85177.1 prolyl 4-hydroxylase [Rhodoferax sp. OV413]
MAKPAKSAKSQKPAAALQTVTPALRQWIIDQAEAGFAPDVVLKSMQASGWTEDVAIEAMETTLAAHLQATQERKLLPTAVPVPQPALDDAPLLLDAGDRMVQVLSVMRRPHLVVFGNLLSAEECAELVALAEPRLSRSLTVETKSGGEEVHVDRTSDGMFFTRGENPLVQRIEARIARLLDWPLQNGEGLQVLRYQPGAQYKPHYDYFDPQEPGTPTILKRGGQRVATLIMYLGEPEKGGATIFPDVHLEVAPQRGNAVFFSYDRPHPSTQSLHGGAPVLAGEKWIATKWLREREFN